MWQLKKSIKKPVVLVVGIRSIREPAILIASITVVILTALIVTGILLEQAYDDYRNRLIWEVDYSGYVRAMGGFVVWTSEEGIMYDPDFVPDDREVTMQLVFYNHETGCSLTLEELKSQFAMSRTETEGIDDLIAYSGFINKNGISEGKNETFNSCESCCRQILTESGIDPDGATTEEVTEAFNKAIIVETYMLENGYGHYRYSLQGKEFIDEALTTYEEEQ